MPQLGMGELIIIFLVVLLLFGANQIPKVAKGLGQGLREFKQTVDRYINEFERLLDEVSRDDRGQVVARTYLTSETGKVYTMLAHAAGRFD